MGSEWERGWFCFVMLAPDAGVLSGRDLVMGFYLCFLPLVCLFAMLLCFIHLIIVRYAFSFAFSLFVCFAARQIPFSNEVVFHQRSILCMIDQD
jgi:hypothetical protein